ncbi:pyridoxal phosphate-dependent decarboxylase family protein [Nocardia vermiculata]|uniref:Pyridoxal-dependent decarboxylase n=1 Tax=Nocardia vermiculata TaxID=257274 RepID=A0A846Y271_9NOCA|nr:pyridoxal-dependent decarboxylase [Nocardia vermiculata]NKY51801.1 pyridoxal-dependent decarboxylase [Nocardia vermiculata]
MTDIETICAASDIKGFIGPGGLDRDSTRRLLGQVIDVGLAFKYRRRFMLPRDGVTLDSIAVDALPWAGCDLGEVLSQLESRYLPTMPNFASPMFAGFPDAGNNLAAVAGAVLGELIDVNLINADFCSRGATEMEIALIRWLRELVGFEVPPRPPRTASEVGGIPTTGGTGANFGAVLMARERAFPGCREVGLPSCARPVIVLPEGIGHYTIAAAAAWAGLGNTAVAHHAVRDYRYDLIELDRRLHDARAAGQQVIMAVCYAGDSRTMAIENLSEFAEVVRRHYPDAWLHCDGCHGTSLLFSDRHRSRLDGLECFDSVMLDPHKVLSVPYTNSFLLLRSPRDAQLVATESELILRQARSFGQITPATGSRSFQSLRTWMLLKSLGVEGVGRMIEARIDAANRFAHLVDEHPGFVRLNDVSINSVAFTVVPPGARIPFDVETAGRSAALTTRAYERMLADGAMYLHSFVLPDSGNRLGLGRDHSHPVLRFMSGNSLIREKDLAALLDATVDYIGDGRVG